MRAKAIIEYTRRIITKVELVNGQAYRIDPGKNYVIVFDNRSLTKDDVAKVNDIIHRDFGAKSVSVVLHGDPNNMKIVEVPNE